MPTGYKLIDKEGELKTLKGIPNLTIENLFPKQKPGRWYCLKCSSPTNKMLLFPINKDRPAEYWICKNEDCKHKITLEQRDKTFEDIRKHLQEALNLYKLDYDHNADKWTIISGDWNGQDRIDATRQKLGPEKRKDIIDEFKDMISDKLQIYVQTIKDYFIE